jgi:hypothetical protein
MTPAAAAALMAMITVPMGPGGGDAPETREPGVAEGVEKRSKRLIPSGSLRSPNPCNSVVGSHRFVPK